ncbi:MAG TPA: type II secretion system secretin GspD [Gammaproteobacteria bacterium]|nr:type II secretion system secretin GspD [Gammaproteobacteria bacterium]
MKQFSQIIIALLLLSAITGSMAAEPFPKENISPPSPAIAPDKNTPPAVVMSAAADNTDPNNPLPADTQPAQEGRLWNLQDADILSVINEVSLETGKNFIVDPRVTGKITLVSSKPIKPSEVYQVFLSVLGLIGYSAVPSGNVIKIVPNMESGEHATKIVNRLAPGRGDEVVVRVIPLDNVSANQLIPIIRPLMPQWSNISAYTPGNVLILLGRAGNLQRIANIIRDIDQTSSTNIDVVPLHQASASQLATVLNNLQNASRATGDSPQVSIAADERSNSILLSGNKSARLHMRYLISHLDMPSSGSQGNTQVIYLRYLQAVKFAPLLGKIAQNMLGKDLGKDSTPPSSSSTAVSNNITVNSGNNNKQPENRTTIQAEPNTNAIIITAPPSMMRALNAIVAKLDIRPAQVLVEGIIVEVNQSDLKNLGIQWGSLTGAATIPTPTNPSDFPVPGAGNVGIIPNTSLVAILNMLENTSGTNILSTPSIAVLDNQKAILEIGQQVPIQSGSYATTGGANTVTPFNTIDMKPVTLKLQVIPQINLGDAVRLIINLKNDSLQNPNSPGLTPIINTSNIQNAVIINSCDVLVLGGLISNNVNETLNKVPILGDLPVVGLLFQQKNRQVQKKNLLVFLKPTILRNPDDYTTITNTKYNKIRDVQINWPQDLSKTPARAPSVLPPWQNNTELPKPFEKVN